MSWNLGTALERFLSLPTYTKGLLGFATLALILELVLRRFPRSAALRIWRRAVDALGAVWTTLLLALIYLLAVGPLHLVLRISRRLPLDRNFASGASAWRPCQPHALGPQRAARHQF